MGDRRFRIVENKATSSAELYIYDTIGPTWAGMVGAKGVIDSLKEMGDVKNIGVHINSNGGSVWEGLGIYNALKNSPAHVSVHIDGIALSSASFIAMAGDDINIAENGMIMIHAPASMVFGSAADMRKQADLLDQVNQQIVDTYVSRTGLEQSEVAAMVAAETWMTAKDALAKGFATKITPNKAVSANFDVSNYKNVPDWCREALATAGVVNSSLEVTIVSDTNQQPEPVKQPEPVQTGTVVFTNSVQQVDVVAIEEAAKLAERHRTRDITAICARAGHPEAATKFIDENLSIADVQAKMFDQMCKDRVPVGDIKEPTNSPVDTNEAKWRAEWEANKPMNEQLGVTLEMYVASRKKNAATAK